MSAVHRPRFHSWIALALALFVVVGFSRTYYFRFLSDLPPLTTLVHLHGIVFTAWVLVFATQTRLVAAHRVELHRKLGIAAIGLAGLILVVGFLTVAVKANSPRVHPSGLTPTQFTVVGLTSLVMFATFIGLGLTFRRKPSMHRRFMVLAMIAVMAPPSSRILTMLGLRDYWSYLVPVMPAVFVAWCLWQDWRQHRIVHPIYAIGGGTILALWPLHLMAGRSEWYQPIGEAIARAGAALT